MGGQLADCCTTRNHNKPNKKNDVSNIEIFTLYITDKNTNRNRSRRYKNE